MYNYDDIEGMLPDESGSVDELMGGTLYPFFQWVEAEPTSLQFKRGGFAIPIENFPVGADAQPTLVKFPGGSVKQMIAFETLEVLVLSHRQDWGYIDPQSNRKVAVGGYDQAKAICDSMGQYPKSRTRYLVLAKGLEECGPMILTIWSTKGSRLAQAVQSFFRLVWRPANDRFVKDQAARGVEHPRQLPSYTFYCPITAGDPVRASRDPKRAAMITPPVLALPSEWTEDQYVAWAWEHAAPKSVMQIAASFWNEASAWAQAPINFATGEPVATDSPIMPQQQAPAPARTMQQAPAPAPAPAPASGRPQRPPSLNQGGAQPPAPAPQFAPEPPPWMED